MLHLDGLYTVTLDKTTSWSRVKKTKHKVCIPRNNSLQVIKDFIKIKSM